MPKPEWGTKRVCESCSARFYDFGRMPIICPACEAAFDLATVTRVKRSSATKVQGNESEAAKKPIAVAENDEAESETDEDAEVTEIDEIDDIDGMEGKSANDSEAAADTNDLDEEEDESALVEDASELGEADDMSDVIDTSVDDEGEQS